jgi:hypothetical protein
LVNPSFPENVRTMVVTGTWIDLEPTGREQRPLHERSIRLVERTIAVNIN